MLFALAEDGSFKILICENKSTNEIHSLYMFSFTFIWKDCYPSIADLDRKTVKLIDSKKALQILEKFSGVTAEGRKISEFIKAYKELPF